MSVAAPRTTHERIHDTRKRLEGDIDLWVSTAASDGIPHLVPLSFLWTGDSFVISTTLSSPTARNLTAGGTARLALGTTRDVVMVEGTARPLTDEDLSEELGDAFAERTGFDPRTESSPYRYFRISPRRVQAWREANELKGRTIMADGAWLA